MAKKQPAVYAPTTFENPSIDTSDMVRAYKIHNDVQTSFCGVRVQADEHGKEYFLLPAYAKNLVDQHINLVWPADEE